MVIVEACNKLRMDRMCKVKKSVAIHGRSFAVVNVLKQEVGANQNLNHKRLAKIPLQACSAMLLQFASKK